MAKKSKKRSRVAQRRHGWSAKQWGFEAAPKTALANYFYEHELSPTEGSGLECASIPHANVLVNAGTTSARVCQRWLDDIKRQWESGTGPFINWHTPGTLLAAILREFCAENPGLQRAMRLHLFPGQVDWNLECVTGDEPAGYLKVSGRKFTHTLLSVHRIDLRAGQAYFLFPAEVPIQAALAKQQSTHKHIFLTPSKFEPIAGDPGYTIEELLADGCDATLHVAAFDEELAERAKSEFDELCENLEKRSKNRKRRVVERQLKLCLIKQNGEAVNGVYRRTLRLPKAKD